MRRNLHLRLQGTTWYFRRRVPDALRGRIGRQEFVWTLGTGHSREAVRRARHLWLFCDWLFETVSQTPSLSQQQIQAIVKERLELWRSRDEARLASGEPLIHSFDPLPDGAEDAILDTYAHDARVALQRNDLSQVRSLATELAEENGIDPDGADGQQLAGALLRSVADYSAHILRRYREVNGQLLNPRSPGGGSTSDVTTPTAVLRPGPGGTTSPPCQ